MLKETSSDGKRVPCLVCNSRFSLTAEQKAVLMKAVEFNQLAEEYSLAEWHKLTSQYGSRDWVDGARLCEIKKTVESMIGWWDCESEALRVFRGALHIALAVGVFSNREHREASRILAVMSRFVSHLVNHKESHPDVATNSEDWNKPLYLGPDLELAWALAPDLEGHSLDEMREILRGKLDAMLSECKEEAATGHWGRGDRLRTLDGAIWMAVREIEQKADEWREQIGQADDCPEVFHLATELHDRVFLIDECLAMGCMAADHLTSGASELVKAVEKVSDLIDWDECPKLKEFCEKVNERELQLSLRDIEIPF